MTIGTQNDADRYRQVQGRRDWRTMGREDLGGGLVIDWGSDSSCHYCRRD